MKRLAITFFATIFCVLLALAAGLYGYGYFSKRLTPSPLPPDVAAAENALAVPGLIAIGRFDVYFARRLEEVLAGFGDPGALPNPVRDDRSFPGLVKAAGVDFTQQVDYALAASVLNEQTAQAVALLFGKFPAQKIRDSLDGAYDVTKETAGGRDILILTRKNPERCEAPESFAVSLTDSRVVFGNRDLVIRTLDRMDARAEPLIDVKLWKKFGSDGVFAAALLLPGEASKMTTQPGVSTLLGSIKNSNNDIKSVFLAGEPQVVPPGLSVSVSVVASKDWVAEAETRLTAWRDAAAAQAGQTLPTLTALLDSLSVSADGHRLALETAISGELNRSITSLPGEIMSFAFGSAAPEDSAVTEKTVAPDTLPQFVAETGHDKLPPFAKDDFTAAAVSGPFGVRVKNLQVRTMPDGDVTEIVLETRSSDIPNTPSDNSHVGATGDSYAQVQIARVHDDAGNDLLREETCGAERNGKPGPLTSTTAGRFVGNEFRGFTELRGEKTLRLKPGTSAEDIARLEGHARLRLPVKTRTLSLKPPFSGQSAQNEKMRLIFLPARGNRLRYQISGQTDMILDVRAKNAKGEYLASSGAAAMDRIFDAGRIIEREYKGRIAQAEVVLADEIVEKDYPFAITKFMPTFPPWDTPEAFTVATMTKEALLAAPVAKPGQNTPLQSCAAAPKAQTALPPFTLCAWQSASALGKKVTGRLAFVLPALPALVNNPSAVEVRLEKLNLKADGKNPEGRTLDVNVRTFAALSSLDQQGRTIEESIPLEFETPEPIMPAQIESLEGQIALRLPTSFATMTLDARRLGNTAVNLDLFDPAQTPAIASARLSAMSEGRIEVEVQGDRTKIVQLVPRGPKGAALKATAPETRTAGPDRTVYSLRVSGKPAKVDIIYALTQDKISYDFEIPALDQNSAGH